MQFQEQMMTKDYIHMIKRKRTKRQRIASIYPRLALTMVTSSSSTAGADGGGGGGFSIGGSAVMSTDVSGSSDCITLTPSNSINSGEFTESTTDEVEEEEEEDMANCLILLAKGSSQISSSQPLNQATVNKTAPLTVAHAEVNYQCKTCNKSFSSFQALGGHRASHKRSPIIKPIFTSTEDKKPLGDFKEESVPSNNDGSTSTTNIVSLKITGTGLSLGCGQVPQNKSRIHECAICGAEFASGQALGGHMRRHRQQLPPAAISSNKNESQEAAKKPRNVLSLDLNLPAPEVDDQREYSNLPFAPKEQVIVFSRPSPLVDCHY